MGQFKKAFRQQGVVVYATSISSDKKAVTLLFDNLQVELEARDFDSVATRTFSLSLPLESTEKDGRYAIDIRGSVEVTEAANPLLVAQVIGQTQVYNRSRGFNGRDLNVRIDWPVFR